MLDVTGAYLNSHRAVGSGGGFTPPKKIGLNRFC